MVVVEDFKVQLVSVEEKHDTYRTKLGGQWKFQKRRRPFREHTRDGKTYVEVEPDEEYYISIEKIRPSTQKLYTDYYVDGQSLHFHVTWERECLSEHGPRIVGIHSRHNGIKTTQALQFVKATCTSATAAATTSRNTPDNDGRKKESNSAPSTTSSMAGMGQIQMMVFEAIPKQVKKRPKVHTASSFATSTIEMTASAVSHSRITATKKNVRSGAGVTATVEEASGNYERDRARYYLSNTKGEYLYTITLYYCAPPGLIAVGILSQPPAYWTHARTVHPTTNTTIERAHITKGIKSEHRDHHTGNVIIELVEDDDETDAADAKADPTSENTKQNTADTNNNIGMVMHPDDDDNRIEEQQQNESSAVSPQTKKFKSNPIDI